MSRTEQSSYLEGINGELEIILMSIPLKYFIITWSKMNMN